MVSGRPQITLPLMEEGVSIERNNEVARGRGLDEV